MIVRCVRREYADLPESYITPAMNLGRDTVRTTIEVGREYVVYAIRAAENQIHYYVYEDEEIPYPYANPAAFFEIVDPTPSKYWQVHFDGERNRLEIAFAEWFADPWFYDKLTDWEEHEKEIFRRVKALMDAEAEALRRRE